MSHPIFHLTVLLVLAVATLGCTGGAATHPVKGQFQLEGGDASQLSGHVVEAVLETDPQVRASGEIQSDGSFTLESLHAGVIQEGATAGKYQARIVLSDDDGERRRAAAKALNPKYFAFEKSGLAFEVPAAETVALKLSRR
jgi:hypothetical protein